MTADDDTIEARAERLAQHEDCSLCRSPYNPDNECGCQGGDPVWCHDDHRTSAEQRAAALDACVELAAYFEAQGWKVPYDIHAAYDIIQRTEVPV